MKRNKSFCFLTNMSVFLKSRNIQISEEALGILLEMYGLYYSSSETPYEQLHGRNCNMRELFDRFDRLMNGRMISYTFPDTMRVEEIQNLLEEYQAVVLWGDDYFDEASLNYMRYHVMRPIVVKGIRENEADIFDMNRKTISKTAFYQRIMGEKIELFALKKDYIFYLDEKRELKRGLRNTAKIFLNNEEKRGEKAFNQFIADFMNEKEPEQMHRYYIQMNRNGGCANMREYMAAFFYQYGKHIVNDDCLEFTKVCTECYEQWHRIGNLIFLLSQEINADLKQRIMKRLELLKIRECEMFKKILESVN